jgi:hypothetical protein
MHKKLKDVFKNHWVISERDDYITLSKKNNVYILHIGNGRNFERNRHSARMRFPDKQLFEIQIRNNKIALRRIRAEKDILKQKSHIWKLKLYYCEDCKKFYKKEDGRFLNDTFLCNICYNKKFGTCDNCHSEMKVEDLIGINGKYYCRTCTQRDFRRCYNCDDWFSRVNTHLGADDEYYCGDCWCDRFASCSACGSTHYQDDLRFNEESGNHYCSNCYDEDTSIHECCYNPPIWNKMSLQHEHNPLLMGFELEVENKEENGREYAEDLLDKIGHTLFYLKEDGSLDYGGFEIVSHPMTRQYIHKNIKIKEMLDWLRKKGFTSYKGGNCGLHIHFNRKYLKDSEILKLKIFFSVNKKHLVKFCQRENTRYAAYEDFSPFSLTDNDIDSIYNEEKYVAVNTSRRTIEIRAFRGTLNYDRFLASIQFVDAIVNFVKHNSAVCLFNGRSWAEFLNYLNKNKEYTHLYRHLQKRKLHYRIMFNKTYGIKLNREQ